MASPDKHKVAAYLTDRENQALEILADRLSVSKSKAMAMAILSMTDSDKVSLPTVAPKSSDKVATDLEPINRAIANITNQLEQLAKIPENQSDFPDIEAMVKLQVETAIADGIKKPLDQVVDMQGEVFGRVSKTEAKLEALEVELEAVKKLESVA